MVAVMDRETINTNTVLLDPDQKSPRAQEFEEKLAARIVGQDLVFRLTRPLTAAQVTEIERRFEDILKGPVDQAPGPVPQELNEFPELPRLLLPFNRGSYARLRLLIDFVNTL